ncbi:hypothetical protein HY405_00830 [Candidatus Microgenomates bacterium]|nr:hypothetical protein [Candidatus Microgenomates bacterium]
MKDVYLRSRRRLIILLVLFSVFFVAFPVVFLSNYTPLRTIIIEEYCVNQAKKIVGNAWNRCVAPTEEEIKEMPDIQCIALGYREQLNCERRVNRFFLPIQR